MPSNHFENVVTEVQNVPQSQKTDRLISGIITEMQQSGEPQVANWGTQLAQLKPQLLKACQQSG